MTQLKGQIAASIGNQYQLHIADPTSALQKNCSSARPKDRGSYGNKKLVPIFERCTLALSLLV